MTPTRSQVENWDTEHLNAAADHWTKTAIVWEDRFTQLAVQIANPGGTPWEGEAAEAAQQRAHSDRMIVIGLADQLHDASAIARRGATELQEACRLVMRSVQSAQDAGFIVGEDFSVTDGHQYSRAAAAARQAQAEAFAADLRARVGTLVATDERIASEITASTAGLGNDHFADQKAVTDELLGNTADGKKPSTTPGRDSPLGFIADHPTPDSEPVEQFSWKPTPTDVATGAAASIAGTAHDGALQAAARRAAPEDAVVRWTKELKVKGVEIPGFTKAGGLMALATTPMGLISDYTDARATGATKLAAAGQAVARETAANATGLAAGALTAGATEALVVGGGTWLASNLGAAETGAMIGSVVPGAGTAVGLVVGAAVGGLFAMGASKFVESLFG